MMNSANPGSINFPIFLLLTSGFLLNTILAENVTKIERLIYDKCRIYSSDSSVYDLIKADISTLEDFQTYAASFLGPGKEQFCNDERPRLIGIIHKLSKDMKPCFVGKEEYIPRFLYESVKEFLTFICSDRNMENFFSSQGKECTSALRSAGAGNEVNTCFKKLIAPFDSTLKKEELCRDLKSAKTCFGEALDRHCPMFQGYQSLNEKFYEAVRKPCNPSAAATICLNNIVFLCVVFLSSRKLFSIL